MAPAVSVLDSAMTLRLHSRAGRPFPQARTELAYGEFLRRNRRRVDARAHLSAALQVFTDLRAEPWAGRATQELRASGVTARRRDVTTTGTSPRRNARRRCSSAPAWATTTSPPDCSSARGPWSTT